MYTNSIQHGYVEIPDGYSKICHCGRRHGYPSFGPRDLDIEICSGCQNGRPLTEDEERRKKRKGLTRLTKRATTISPVNY